MLDHPKAPKPSIRLCFSRVLIKELQFDFQGRVSMKTCIFQSLLNPSATQNSHNARGTQAHQCLLCFHRLIKNIHCSPWGVSPSCKTRDCSHSPSSRSFPWKNEAGGRAGASLTPPSQAGMQRLIPDHTQE